MSKEMSDSLKQMREWGVLRRCREPGCRNKTLIGDIYCEECKEKKGEDTKENKRKSRHSLYNKYKRDKKSAKFYDSAEWRRLRVEIIKRDKELCQRCKRKGRYKLLPRGRGGVVHHKMYLKERWDLRLEPSNLELLCHSCHNEVHANDDKKY